MELKDLPPDLLAQTITYLSFKEVENLCSTDKTIKSFCLGTRPSHKRIWRELILNTFRNIPNINSIIENTFNCKGDSCWNYITYTNLVKALPEYVQGLIYLRMNDMESLKDLDSELINIIAIVENRKDLIVSDGSESESIARSLTVPMLRRRMFGKSLSVVIKYPEALKSILSRQDISKNDILAALDKATRDVELGEDRTESIKLLEERLSQL